MRRYRRRTAVLATMLAATTVVSSCAIGVYPPPIPGPAPAGDGGERGTWVPGNEGPCGSVRHAVDNPAQWDLATYVFEPTGPGMCASGDRPVIFFGHGYSASFTEGYTQFIDHLVSEGFVVIYPGYQLAFDPPQQYRSEDAGFVAGVASLPPGRVDLTRIGFVGHSFGAGMIPRMMQLADGRGWGSTAMWAAILSPAWAFFVGGVEHGDGPIALPAHARVMTINYDWDVFVDTRVATEMLQAMTIPESHKLQMLIRSDLRFEPALASDHLLPLTLPVVNSVDHYDRWANWRPIDLWSRCALDGAYCSVDYADMGTYHGREVKRALVARNGEYLPDIGPGALVECESLLSPRRCPR